jgi:DNA-binding NarL/FixJ family response regulator
MKDIRILIADDHTLVREGIKLLLESRDGFEVVAEVSDGREAVKKSGELKPDIVLMDISMPVLNGLMATGQIVKQYPNIKVLALTMHEDHETVRQILKAGAAGYIIKKSAASDLFSAIEAVCGGEAFFSPSVSRIVLEGYMNAQDETEEILTPREMEILQLLAEGHPNREIASMLYISVKTVENHKENIKKKLGVTDQAGLMKYAIMKGLVSLQNREESR